MTLSMKYFQNKCIYFALIIQIVYSDICSFKQDGTGLLNNYHQLYVNGNCFPCLIQCKTCDSILDDSCSLGNCQQNFFFNSFSSKCQRCSSLCKSCIGSLQQDCQVCVDGFYFDILSKECKNCPFGSKSCSGITVSSCYQKYYLDSQSLTCRKCPSNCLICNSENYCQQCEDQYFLYQNNICKRCQINNCSKCFNASTCYQCVSGYILNSSSYCNIANCSQQSCSKCLENKEVCIQCEQKYYLFQYKCYFGSSLLCLSGINGSSYGKCLSCIEQVAFSNENNPTFCLLSQSIERVLKYQFKSFYSFSVCNFPQFMTHQGSYQYNIKIAIEPIFQIQLQIRLISNLNVSFIQVSLYDSDGQLNFINLNISQRKSGILYCKEKGSLSNTDSLSVLRIAQTFQVTSLNQNITLKIGDGLLTSKIYLSEILIKKRLCLVQHCKACFTTGICSFCSQGYLLEQYECKLKCSQGYFTDNYKNKCVQQCADGYYLVSNEGYCQKCQNECLICNKINSCTKCNNGYFLNGQICLSFCIDNSTFADNKTNQCKKCRNPCKTCSNSLNNCSSCLTGSLFNQKCISQCPILYFSSFKDSIAICSLCSSNCKQCSINSQYCLQCFQNLTLYNGKCLKACPSGYFSIYTDKASQLNLSCQLCSSICENCIGIYNNCTSCSLGSLFLTTYVQLQSLNTSLIMNTQILTIYNIFQLSPFLNNSAGICLTVCPSMYFYEDQSIKLCKRCPQSCSKCQDSYNCSYCMNNYFLQNGTCLTKCSKQTLYMNQAKKKCQRCKIPCQECQTDFSGINCKNCIDGYYKFTINDKIMCVIKCPQGYYKNNNSSLKCQKCPQNCTQCVSDVYCTICKQNYFLSNNHQCALEVQCQIGFFANNLSNSCQKCIETCKACQNYSYFCKSCSNNYLFLVVDQGICLEQCPVGYFERKRYIISSNLTLTFNQNDLIGNNYSLFYLCQKCPSNCIECVSNQSCIMCSPQFALINESCFTNCPKYYFEESHSQGKICRPCPSNCNKCLGIQYCIQCIAPTFLIQNQCQNSCFDGYYLQIIINQQKQSIYQCLYCPSQCQKCVNIDNCSSCNFGFYLELNQTSNKSQCKTFCSQGRFQNKISRSCDLCEDPCKTCLNSEVCITCQNNLALLNQNCVLNCPETFYIKLNNITQLFDCEPCIYPCKYCKSANLCSECQVGYFLDQTQFFCSFNCQDGFFSNNLTKKCQKCQKPCKTCDLSPNQCLTCIEGFYFRNNLCLSICPSGSYLHFNGINYLCQDCEINCKTCKSPSFCTRCELNYFLLDFINQINQISGQKCVQNCAQGYYMSGQARKCINCNQKCKTCAKDMLTCTSCYSGHFLLKNICIEQCPQFYFKNISISVCDQCGKWCQLCQSQLSCTKCISGYLFKGQCQSECPSGYYQNKQNLLCLNCMDGCQICKDLYVCQKCSEQKNFILYQNQCLNSTCPDGYYHFVQQNQCVENCSFLTNKIEMKCHLQKCPSNMIVSSDKMQCIKNCLQNQFIGYDKQKDTIKCLSILQIQAKNIKIEDLPIFKIQVVPSYRKIFVLMRFSFNAFNLINFEQLLDSFELSLQYISKSVLSQQYKSSSSIQLQNKAYVKQVSLSNSQTTQFQKTDIDFQIIKGEIIKNGVLLQIKFNENSINLQFKQKYIFKAQMKNPYRTYFCNINGEQIPLQNYYAQVQFTQLNYQSSNDNYLGLSVIVWILIILTIGLCLIMQFFVSQHSKYYIFGSTIQYFQLMYFLTFISLNLPPLIQDLFFSFRFSTGNLILSTILNQSQSLLQLSEVMMSPWQIYKYSRDINLFRNLSDVLMIFGIILIILTISKIINHFTNVCKQLTNKVLKNKIKILENFIWIFIPCIGFYSLINIFYKPQSTKYEAQLQKSIGYKVIAYLITIIYCICPIYFFYHQYSDKKRYDKGLNQQKRKLGVSIWLYRIFRKVLFIFFLTYYYENSTYCVCIFLLSSSIIFIMIYWFEPYKNPIRQRLSTIQEGSLIILFSQILIFLLNPDYYSWISFIIVIHVIFHMVLLLIYPSFVIFVFLREGIDVQYGQNEDIQYNSEGFSLREDNKGDQKLKYQNQLDQQNNSASTKMNFGTIIRKKNKQNNVDEQISAHDADESDQGDVIKKNIMNNVIRLAKKQTKKVKMFKNYDFSSDENENCEQKQQKSETNKRQIDGYKLKKHQY